MSGHEHTTESSGNVAHSESRKEHGGIFKKIFHHHENKDNDSKSVEPSTTAGFLDPGPTSRIPNLHDDKNHDAENGADAHDHKKRERNRLHKEPPKHVKQQWYEESHPTEARSNQPIQQGQDQYQSHDYATNTAPASVVASGVAHNERKNHGTGHHTHTEHEENNHNKALGEPHPHHNQDTAILQQSRHSESTNVTQPQPSYSQQAIHQDGRHGVTQSEVVGGAAGVGAATFAHHYKDKHVANTTQQPMPPRESIAPPKHTEITPPGHGPPVASVGTGGFGHNQDRQIVNEAKHSVSTYPSATSSQPASAQSQPKYREDNHVADAATATAGASGIAGLASHNQNGRHGNTLDGTTDEVLPAVPATDGKFMDLTPSTFNIDQSASDATSRQPAPEQPSIASARIETNTIGQANALKQSTDFKQPDDLKQPTYFERPVDARHNAEDSVQGGSVSSHTGHLADAFSPGLEGVNMPGKYPKKA